jgi:uncharacterized protein YjbJ (UPF0337 family)
VTRSTDEDWSPAFAPGFFLYAMWDCEPMRMRTFSSMVVVWHLLHRFLPFTFKKVTMNKDQIKGSVKDITGKVQEATGKAIDSPEMQIKGLQKQAVGNAEKAIGDAKEGVKDIGNAVKHATKAH